MAETIYLVRGLGIPERAFRNRADAERYSFDHIPLTENPFRRCFLWQERDALVLFPLFLNDPNLSAEVEMGTFSYADLYDAFHGEKPWEMPYPVAPSDRSKPYFLLLVKLEYLAKGLGLQLPKVSGEREVEPWYTWWEEAKVRLTEEQQRYFWSHVLPEPHAIVELEWEE